MELKAIRVKGFKRIADVELTTPQLSIAVGGNNSGKSSLLQAIHFAITVLQSAKLAADAGKASSTLGFDQFIYKPSGDLARLGHGAGITSKSGPQFDFIYTDDGDPEPKTFTLGMKRGKNANLAVSFDSNSTFFARAADLARPFSVFVPGLAGVPLKEELRTPSVVANGIAQGDSNVYLRNVLYRIISQPEKLTKFHEVINSVFPGLRISSSFNPEVHLHIDLTVELDGQNVPLEMVGTGCLQAIQLVAYVTAYNPALLLLDEPDAHLHPYNQRLLAATLLRICQDGSTKVLLATHSRHMFDCLARGDAANLVWLRGGVKQPANEPDTLSILMDLGALDSFELFQQNKPRVVFLTEDTKITRLKTLLAAHGLEEGSYFVQPLHGVNNLVATVPIADFFIKQGENTYVVVHRDRDCMTDEEVQWWRANESKKLPERVHLFVTPLNDIEHMFCRPAHVAAVYGIDVAEAEAEVNRIVNDNSARLLIEFTQKRSELKTTTLKKMENVPSAVDLVKGAIIFNQVRGKSLFPMLLDRLQEQGKNSAHLSSKVTDELRDAALAEFIQAAVNA